MMSLPKPSEYIRPSGKRNAKEIIGRKGGEVAKGASQNQPHSDDNHNSLRSPRDVSRIKQQLHQPIVSPFFRASEDGLRLRRTISGQQQSFSLPTSSSEPLPGEKIATLYDSHRKTPADWPILIGGRGRVKSNDGKYMKHLAETEGGDSGGPLLRRGEDGVWRVVAIHLSCRKDGSYNSAALIDRKVIDKIDFLHSLQREAAEEGRKGYPGGILNGSDTVSSSNIVAFQKPASEFLMS